MALPRILIVEDSSAMSELYQSFLEGQPWTIMSVNTGKAALEVFSQTPPDAVLLDVKLPDSNGIDLLKQMMQAGKPLAAVVMTAYGSINIAVSAMQAGASDFVVKPFSKERLVVTMTNALERLRLNRLVEHFKEGLDRKAFFGFIGSSLEMQAVYHIIEQAAKSKATVFVTGESGVGKELCAEAVHQCSARAKKPFVALNCAAIPKDLMESQIFGHVKGAFTGAVADYQGAAMEADGGSLFLDEICDMDITLQTKLLRFIQTGGVTPVGGTGSRRVDVRFICATNRDPLKEVAEGRFREDLYYRLHVIPIHLPPLRERGKDVLEIAHYFLKKISEDEGKGFKTLSSEVEDILLSANWPGNVRQLENVMRNAIVLHDGDVLERTMLPTPFNHSSFPQEGRILTPTAENKSVILPLWQVEKQAIEEAITFYEGNIPKAAAALGVSPSTLYRKKLSWVGK